jgi:hypothetical protein
LGEKLKEADHAARRMGDGPECPVPVVVGNGLVDLVLIGKLAGRGGTAA